jgi:hypothetical protein
MTCLEGWNNSITGQLQASTWIVSTKKKWTTKCMCSKGKFILCVDSFLYSPYKSKLLDQNTITWDKKNYRDVYAVYLNLHAQYFGLQ